jgi:regulator of protease activity HflC (stomatin/prohibitin superfamily)
MKVTVEAHEKGLRFRDGRFVEVLEPGRYRVARFFAKERITTIDLRLTTLVLQAQEIMTLDKVTLRLTSVVTLRVKDPVKATLAVDDYEKQIYSDVQLALRARVGGLELDTLLSEKTGLGERILEEVKLGADAYGVEVLNVGLRDIVLPGEMKAILNPVMEARKKAEAANIERREEIAATRSQANTAQMLERQRRQNI